MICEDFKNLATFYYGGPQDAVHDQIKNIVKNFYSKASKITLNQAIAQTKYIMEKSAKDKTARHLSGQP
jgi:hypothetical protein